MNSERSSFVPIQQKLNSQKFLVGDSDRKSCMWDDMQGWMEQRQREWDDEMTQLKNEFFSIKPDKLATSRRCSSDLSCSGSSSIPDKMNSTSRFYDSDRGSRMFCLTFDVSQFEPGEVNIRTQGSTLIVHAKHEEQCENKSVSREFNRRVDIPSHINPDTLRCFIRADGTLQVEAELPSPSYDSSSVNRDSPFALENSSTFSDRLSDRDICSPTRTDRDMCSTPGTDRDGSSRDIYSPPKLFRDAYNPQRNGRDVLSPPIRDTDFSTAGALEPHWTDRSMPRNDKGRFNYQITGDNIYTPLANDGHRQTARNSYGATQIGNEIHNSYEIPAARDISDQTTVGTTSDDRTTLRHDLPSDGNNYLACTDVTARRGLHGARPLGAENGRLDGNEGVFSVVVDVGTDFDPNELAVQTVDRKLVVHARHANPHLRYGGDIYREFDLPEGVDPGSITANLTPEGNLFIEAPTNTRPYLIAPTDLSYPHQYHPI